MNIAIDIGTCNTQVATKNKGVIISCVIMRFAVFWQMIIDERIRK